MVAQLAMSDAEIDRVFRALADSTRRDILRRTLTDGASVTDLSASYDMSFAAVQKHVAVLEAAGLIAKEQRGRRKIVTGDVEQLARASALLHAMEDLWRARFSQIDAVLGTSET